MENIKTKFYSVLSWWKYSGKYFHYDFIYGVKNLFKWFKIVWKDRDWDDHFIFEALKFKIKNTMEYTQRRKFFVNWEREVSRMKLCIKLIESIQEQKYEMEWGDYQQSKYDFVPSKNSDIDGKKYYEMVSEVVVDNLDDYFKKYPIVYNKVMKKDGDKSSRIGIAIKMSYENHFRARKLLFKVLEKHIENWWE